MIHREGGAWRSARNGHPGRGHIRQRADKRWEWIYTVKLWNGRTVQKSVIKRRQADLMRERRRILAELEKSGGYARTDLTVGEYLRLWLTDSVEGSVKDTTYDGYESIVRNHLAPRVGHVKVRDLTPAHVIDLKTEVLDDGYSPRTVRYVLQTLGTALEQAVVLGMVAHNPTRGVKKPRRTKPKINPLRREEADRFLAAAKDDRLYPLYLLAVRRGLREGELLGLGEHHVDFDGGFLWVQQTLVRTKKRGLHVQEYDAKSESSHRRVPLGKAQLEALWSHRKRRNAEKLIAGPAWKESGLFFTTRVGTPLNIQSLTYRSFRPLLEEAGCPRIRFHDQRHTFAVLALQNGMPPEVLKRTLGHSSIQVTIDYYGHLFPDYEDEVLGRLDEALATLDRAV